MMKLIVLLLCTGVTFVSAQDDANGEVRYPPSIKTPAQAQSIYEREGNPVKLECQADGKPTPTYSWYYRGIGDDKFKAQKNTNNVKFDPNSGTLTIDKMVTAQDGHYMCKATVVFRNQGQTTTEAAALSPPIEVRQTDLKPFIDRPEKVLSKKRYQSLTLECDNQGATIAEQKFFKWYDKTQNGQIADDPRRYIDVKGALHIAYLEKSDEDIRFRCGLSVDNGNSIELGNSYNIEVGDVASSDPVGPSIDFDATKKIVVEAYLYTNAILECAFTGYDPQNKYSLPIIVWRNKLTGQEIKDNEKYQLSHNNRRLTIKNVQESDEKFYTCEASTTTSTLGPYSIFLDVVYQPMLRYSPEDQTIPENDKAVFKCEQKVFSGREAERPEWQINGEPTDSGTYHNKRKYKFNDENTELTIVNLNKANDVLCVLCILKNNYGETRRSACLNVVLRINILDEPPAKQEIEHGDSIDLTVLASTDPGLENELTYSWVYKNKTYSKGSHPPFVTYDPTTKIAYMNTSQLSKEEYDTVGGVYERIVRHKYETRRVYTEVVLKDVEPGPEKTVAAAGFDMWIIGLIIGILFLIIFIIIIIFVLCRKKLEGDYNVDKKEVGAGLDPEKELKDKGFNALSRPGQQDYADYMPQSNKNFDEYDDVPMGADDESLGEYDVEDDNKFNEEGSFIGEYQTRDGKQTHPGATESTI